jgi:hypothetical protein
MKFESVVVSPHLELASTDDEAVFTASLDAVPVINGFLLLVYIAGTSLCDT